jgi:hypothetical protein
VHGVVTSRDGSDGEFKVRGRAALETDQALNARIAHAISEQLGWSPVPGKFHLFRVDVDDITAMRWDDANNDQYMTRWPADVEQVRHGTSATSLDPAKPHRELLD